MSGERRAVVKAANPEDGFTLVELMISILVITLIMGAIVNMFVVSFSATSSSLNSLSTSHDRQLLELNLPRDIESSISATSATQAQLIPLAAGSQVISTTCPLPVPPNTPTVVLDLQWKGSPPTLTSTTTIAGGNITYFAADYGVLKFTAGNPAVTTYRLIRYYCSSANQNGPWTTLNQTTLVYGLATPSLTNYPAYAWCGTSSSGTTTTTTVPPPGCSGSSAPVVTMNITDVSNKNVAKAQYTVSAKMRS